MTFLLPPNIKGLILKNFVRISDFKEIWSFPDGIYLLKVNNRNTRTRCEICSKLRIKTPERRHWRRHVIASWIKKRKIFCPRFFYTFPQQLKKEAFVLFCPTMKTTRNFRIPARHHLCMIFLAFGTIKL